jgi:hypothetical protein
LLDDVAIVGTSRVLPRFRHYAPGVSRAVCGLHAVHLDSGRLLGSLIWTAGNQIFAIEAMPRSMICRFPYQAGTRSDAALRRATDVFYRGPMEN